MRTNAFILLKIFNHVNVKVAANSARVADTSVRWRRCQSVKNIPNTTGMQL